jgi:hypothetical protein
MVDKVPVHDLLLVALLWLGIILYKGWARIRSATCLTTRKPVTPIHKRSRDPKPFPGLTHKPRCAACGQAPEPGFPAPLAPPLLLPSPPGRPCQVGTAAQF